MKEIEKGKGIENERGIEKEIEKEIGKEREKENEKEREKGREKEKENESVIHIEIDREKEKGKGIEIGNEIDFLEREKRIVRKKETVIEKTEEIIRIEKRNEIEILETIKIIRIIVQDMTKNNNFCEASTLNRYNLLFHNWNAIEKNIFFSKINCKKRSMIKKKLNHR